jgi:cytochrome b pre-mRNA-processing protein 3
MIYDKVVAQSRNPVFYTDIGVPDDLSGRYDMLVIHLLILVVALKKFEEDHASELRQHVLQSFTLEMDAIVRDLGMAEGHVEQEVRKIMDLCARQMIAYESAIANGDKKALSNEIVSAFKSANEDSEVNGRVLSEYVFNSISSFQAQPISLISEGRIEFPEIVAQGAR